MECTGKDGNRQGRYPEGRTAGGVRGAPKEQSSDLLPQALGQKALGEERALVHFTGVGPGLGHLSLGAEHVGRQRRDLLVPQDPWLLPHWFLLLFLSTERGEEDIYVATKLKGNTLFFSSFVSKNCKKSCTF